MSELHRGKKLWEVLINRYTSERNRYATELEMDAVAEEAMELGFEKKEVGHMKTALKRDPMWFACYIWVRARFEVDPDVETLIVQMLAMF